MKNPLGASRNRPSLNKAIDTQDWLQETPEIMQLKKPFKDSNPDLLAFAHDFTLWHPKLVTDPTTSYLQNL